MKNWAENEVKIKLVKEKIQIGMVNHLIMVVLVINQH